MRRHQPALVISRRLGGLSSLLMLSFTRVWVSLLAWLRIQLACCRRSIGGLYASVLKPPAAVSTSIEHLRCCIAAADVLRLKLMPECMLALISDQSMFNKLCLLCQNATTTTGVKKQAQTINRQAQTINSEANRLSETRYSNQVQQRARTDQNLSPRVAATSGRWMYS